MIDITNAKWEFSKNEKFVIKWLEDNGYNGKIVKQYISKTIFEISKDGVTDKFELIQSIPSQNIDEYMEQFKRNWEMLCQVQQLRKEVKERNFKRNG